MGGTDFFDILMQTIRSKLTGIVTKLKLWTNPEFIRNKIVIKIREFFSGLLGVKPRNSDDYMTIGNWMISKRLLNSAVLVVGVVSICYLSSETMLFKKFTEEGVKTYKFDSLKLRTAKGHVKITGEGGYLAYDGNVEGGYVEGVGTLYNKEGNVVYTGSFEQNKFEGKGTFNYNSGNIKYYGNFHDNLFDGEGTLYREDGSRIYEGGFSKGLKYGKGILFDSGENAMFEGSFANDEIVYSELLGKSISEVNECYKGRRKLFTTGTESVAVMDSIGALYHAGIDEEALDDEEIVDCVYVLENYFMNAGKQMTTITELTKAFGNPVYKGNSNVILPEAVAINIVNSKKKALNGSIKMDLKYTFSDVAEVTGYDREYVVYITSFKRGDVIYSFVSGSDDNVFSFYYISGTEDESA